MPFSHILGQDTAVTTLTRALTTDRVHHAYRFEGPDGVGKEMAAFALAQALVCVGGDPLGCGHCDACRRVVTFSEERPRSPLHPDIRIIERGFYPPEVLGQRTEETKEISVHQIRAIVLSHAQFPPHEGRARVFLIRAAEEMSIGELKQQISAFGGVGREVRDMKVNYHFKLSIPLSCLVFALCAAPLGIRFARSGSYSGILLGIVVMFLYQNNIWLGKALGMGGLVPPFLAGWSQNIIFGIVGIYLIWREE